MKVKWEDDVATRLRKAVAGLAELTGVATADVKQVAYIVDPDTVDRIVKAAVTVIPKRAKFKASTVVITDDLARGELHLGEPAKVDLWGFSEAFEKHGVTEELRKSRWPTTKVFWLYPIEKVEQWQQPRAFEASKTVDGAATVKILDDDVVELDQQQVEALALAKAISKPMVEQASSFAERQIKYTVDPQFVKRFESLDPTIADLTSALDKLEVDPATYADGPFMSMAADLLVALDKAQPIPDGELKDQIGRSIAAVKAVTLDGDRDLSAKTERLEDRRTITLRKNAVATVDGDRLDLIYNGPFDDGTKRVAMDRIGRAFAKAARHIDNEFNDTSGQVAMYDLCLVPAGVNPVQKADDPMMALPPRRGEYPAAVQLHFCGNEMRVGVRMKAHDRLIGWSVALQKHAKTVDELKDARRLARRFSVDGTPYSKRWENGALAVSDGIVAMDWLDVDAELFQPGEVGASKAAPGMVVRASDQEMRVEYGLQKTQAHEYFFTGDPKFSGRLIFKRVDGADWYSVWSSSLLPLVLTSKAVQNKAMPPDGYSAMPVALEKATPDQWRYWEHKGSEAQRIRDDLVESGFFTRENIKLVDNQFRRVFAKLYLDDPQEAASVDKSMVKYGIAWQYWTTKDDAPARQQWYLMIQDKDVCHTWEMRDDPMIENRIDASYRAIKGVDLIGFEGKLEPGQQLCDGIVNATKSVASWVRAVDTGTAQILEDGDLLRIRLHGKINADVDLTREEDGSQFYSLEIGRSVTEKQRDGRGSSAMVFVERDGDLAYVECPSCSALDLRMVGKSARKDDLRYQVIACNACLAEFGVDADPWDRNEMASKLDAQGRVEFKLRVDKAYRDVSTAAPYVVINAIPVKDGMQVWTGKSTDPDLDPSRLRPPAIYEPMKAASTFEDLPALVDGFAVDAVLKAGVIVEPRFGGRALSLQKKGERVVVLEGDQNVTKSFLWAVKGVKGVKGDFVLDCEAVGDSLVVSDALYVPAAGNVLAKRQLDRRHKLDAFLKDVNHDRIKPMPFTIANNENDLERALTFAGSIKSSKGAVLKSSDAIYAPGVDAQLWAEFTSKQMPSDVQKLMDQAIASEIPIYKTDEERYVLGIVLEPNDGDGVPLEPDTQKDIYGRKDVRDAAHKFMEYFGNIGYMHDGFINDKVKILESYVSPVDFKITDAYGNDLIIRKGTWLLAVRVLDDDMWKRVQIGELTGFSIGGNALRFSEGQNAAA